MKNSVAGKLGLLPPKKKSSPPVSTETSPPSVPTNRPGPDEGKGRIKEAAGSLTGDRSLKNEGKVDRGKATFKDKVDKVADALTGRNKK